MLVAIAADIWLVMLWIGSSKGNGSFAHGHGKVYSFPAGTKRAAMHIFSHAEGLLPRGTRLKVSISSLQIWQEAISDLLGERRSSGPLAIHSASVGAGWLRKGRLAKNLVTLATLLSWRRRWLGSERGR